LRFKRVLAILISALLVFSSAAMAKTTKHSTTSSKARSTSKSKKGKKARQAKGQKSIDSQRTREIQEALIREHYLNGEPSGNMDSATKAALTKLQADNGWQTKVIPDSRALIRLGLGPNQSNLLNPDTAALSSAVASSKNQR
jgi:hypothetical protein